MERFSDIVNKFEEQLKSAKQACVKNSEAQAYNSLGVSYCKAFKYQEAAFCFEKFLSIAIEIGDKEGEETAYANLVVAYHSLGNYDKAMKYQEKLLKTGDKIGEEAVYGGLAVLFQKLEKYTEVIKYTEKVLSIVIEKGNKAKEGKAYFILGVAYEKLGKYDKAINYQEKQLSIAKKIGDKAQEGQAYGNLGVTNGSLGKYGVSINYQERRLSIAKDIGHKTEEAEAYGNLGAVYQLLGNYDEAISCQEKRLSIAIEIGDRHQEGLAYSILGNVFTLLGKYDEAKDYHENALSIAIEMGDRNREGEANGNLGTVCHFLGKYDEALKYHEKLLSIKIDNGNKNGIGVAYGNLGVTYECLGKYNEAIKCQEKRLSIAIEIGDKAGEGQALHNLGSCYLGQANVLNGKNRQENLNFSVNFFKNALQCFEWLFDHLEGKDKLKISVFDTFVDTYKRLTCLLIHLHQVEEALLVAERGRARALGDLLVSNYALRKGCDHSSSILTRDDLESLWPNSYKYSVFVYALRENRFALWHLIKENLVFIQKQIKPIKEFSENEHSNVEEPLEKIVEAAYDEMQVRVRVDCEDRSLDVLEEDVRNYERRDVTEEPTSLLKDQGNKAPLARNGPQENLHPRCIWQEESEKDRGRRLELLYQIFITNVEEDFMQKDVVIIPDGLLFKVPFAALRDPKTQLYLSDTKRIRIAPSLTILRVLQGSSADYQNNTGVLIVGNPAVEEVKVRGETKRFQRLPGAEHEALKISTLMGVTPLIGAKATKQEIIRRLQQGVGVVHIAAHGSSKGKILLAPSPSVRGVPEEKECMLTMDEVQESGCRARLIVLSCCHSGRGKIKAEGVIGLTRAFLAAGARAVVASLWAIDDEATKLFMIFFYKSLKSGESASASLQQAMKELRKISKYKKPRYWAAFFLIGDDVRIVHQTIFAYALQRLFTKPHNLVSPSPGHSFAV